MNLEYQFTEQDYIDFNLYHVHNSPTLKRLFLIERYGGPLLLLMLGSIIYWVSNQSSMFCVIYFIAIAAIWLIIFPKIYEKTLTKRILKMVAEGKRNNLFGRHELRITQDGIKGKTDFSETTWHRIEKVVESKKHVLLYVNSITAIIIPKNAFTSAKEKDCFLDEVSKFTEENTIQ